MPTPVISLQAVVNEMDVIDDTHTAYLNKRTGELITLSEDDTYDLDDRQDLNDLPAWEKEMAEKAREVMDSDDYLELPSKFDIHEWAIMERFCFSIQDRKLREDLLDKTHGTGAFRLFKDAIHRHGIANDWYRFREKALERIAVDWLEANQIVYRRDTEDSSHQPAREDNQNNKHGKG